MEDLPTLACDVADEWLFLPELAETLLRHSSRADDLRGDSEDEALRHAIAAVVYGSTLFERALHYRWSTAAEALRLGCSWSDVTAAMGVADRELYDGLARWVKEQMREGSFVPHRVYDVLELLADDGWAALAAGGSGSGAAWQWVSLRRLAKLHAVEQGEVGACGPDC